jgi:hypothetical protein
MEPRYGVDVDHKMNLRFEPMSKECGLENYFITVDLGLRVISQLLLLTPCSDSQCSIRLENWWSPHSPCTCVRNPARMM